ncbi:MAG: hypothetical protein JNN11_04430 [Candidatus Doudnabacteria bacterium]|nr:hypothetical protein [Candidatus Doudnabacteria bacterium]
MGKSQNLYKAGLAALEQGKLEVREDVCGWVQEVSSRQLIVAATYTLPDYISSAMGDLGHVYEAGFHYPAHTTVLIVEGAGEALEDNIKAQIMGLQLKPPGEEMVFRNFLLTPTGEFLLTNDQPPAFMSVWRETVQQCLPQLPEGVQVKVPDWIHSTVGRLTSKEVNQDRLRGMVEDLAGTVREHSVCVEIDELFIGNGWELLSAGSVWILEQ